MIKIDEQIKEEIFRRLEKEKQKIENLNNLKIKSIDSFGKNYIIILKDEENNKEIAITRHKNNFLMFRSVKIKNYGFSTKWDYFIVYEITKQIEDEKKKYDKLIVNWKDFWEYKFIFDFKFSKDWKHFAYEWYVDDEIEYFKKAVFKDGLPYYVDWVVIDYYFTDRWNLVIYCKQNGKYVIYKEGNKLKKLIKLKNPIENIKCYEDDVYYMAKIGNKKILCKNNRKVLENVKYFEIINNQLIIYF